MNLSLKIIENSLDKLILLISIGSLERGKDKGGLKLGLKDRVFRRPVCRFKRGFRGEFGIQQAGL